MWYAQAVRMNPMGATKAKRKPQPPMPRRPLTMKPLPPHEPEQPILLATGQLDDGHITSRGMGSKPGNRELFLTRDNTMQSSNRSLLKQVEVLG